jgi:type II restriction enzyme
MITPARFLFDAGYTPKVWNEKMLNDEHFKVGYYEPDSSQIFRNTDIKGGIAISYRDSSKVYGAIGTFTKYPEVNDILRKVKNCSEKYMDEIIHSPLSFQLTDLMKREHPDLIDRLRTSAFTNLQAIFYEKIPDDDHDYISMIGLINNKRTIRYVRRDYIKDSSGTLDSYTLLMPKASGSGAFGEQAGPTVIAEPGLGYTQTFISIGKFNNNSEPQNVQKYIKTKFLRTMLSILKITQDCPAPKWKWVPIQDFTDKSDINWSTSISNIDMQLYKKYNLSDEEIDFIETNVKEMD